jgi:hypothetical protein
MALVTAVQEAAHTTSAPGRAILYGWAILLSLAITASMIFTSMTVAMLTVYGGLATVWVAGGVRRPPARAG